jgi:hypothetical protein
MRAIHRSDIGDAKEFNLFPALLERHACYMPGGGE